MGNKKYCVLSPLWRHRSFALLFLVLIIGSTTVSAQIKLTLKNDSGQSIPDTLLFRLKTAQGAITEINTANKNGYRTEQIKADLADIRNNIAPIKADLNTRSRVIEPKTLISYNLILKKSEKKLAEWQAVLSKSSNDLQRMSKEVLDLSHDSLLIVNTNDTTAKTFYVKQLVDINLKLQEAGRSTVANLDTVNRLLAAVSAVTMEIADMHENIDGRIETSGKSALRKESPYIWSAPKEKSEENIGDVLASSYIGQNRILSYFINSTWDNRSMLLLFGIAFFLWIYLNFRKIKKAELRDKVSEADFRYIKPIPILAAIIVLLNLTPLFEPDSPALYIEVIVFALLIALTINFWRKIPSNQFRYWVFIVLLYVVMVISTAAVHSAVFMRLWLILLNVASMYIGIRFYKKLKSINMGEKFIKPVLVIYLLFNFLSILLNALGRISLAKIYSITAIIGLVQVIGLAIFIQIFTEALELQIKISACNGGLFSRLNISKTRISFKRALSVVAVILWLLVFLINLSISGGVFAFVHQLLVKPRMFGSVSFTLNNVLFFVVILYISNVLQKNVGVLFGEKSVAFTNEVEHKSSQLTLIRLVIALIGVLLAVTASGIPLDRLTVVLGALSVGIGLGMQNIVNNFVSGIILIFEKPFQIGDYIELADKKGKIQDIGIRASRMFTQQGSEVIIPNGDLLSNRLVNWTQNTAYVKSEILFKVNITTDIALITKMVQEEIARSTDAVKNIPPEVLINSLSADAIELRILVWINSVYIESKFKSQLFTALISRFNDAQIKLM